MSESRSRTILMEKITCQHCTALQPSEEGERWLAFGFTFSDSEWQHLLNQQLNDLVWLDTLDRFKHMQARHNDLQLIMEDEDENDSR